jgi:hypothetical protein
MWHASSTPHPDLWMPCGPIDIEQSFRAIKHLAAQELHERLRATHTAKQFGLVPDRSVPGRVMLRVRVKQRHNQDQEVVSLP